MLSGHQIALRIEQLMRQSPQTSKTKIGGLLTEKKDATPRAKRKHYNRLLKHLRKEKIIAELRTVAGYLGVSLRFLLFGEQSASEYSGSSGDIANRLAEMARQLAKVEGKLEENRRSFSS